MKEQRLITENQILESYLAEAHKLRSQELARLSKRLFCLPGLLLNRASGIAWSAHPNPK
jgi:hypothetical protein